MMTVYRSVKRVTVTTIVLENLFSLAVHRVIAITVAMEPFKMRMKNVKGIQIVMFQQVKYV